MLRTIYALGFTLISMIPNSADAKKNASPRVHYTIAITDPKSHYAEVTLRLEDLKPGSLDIYMPVWTPGSYLVREFAKNVESVSARGLSLDESKMVFAEEPLNFGSPITPNKLDKNTWRLTIPKGVTAVEFRYSVYCFELSVRTSFIDDDQALLNMASVLMTVKGSEHLGGDLAIYYPVRWFKTATALDQSSYESAVDREYTPAELGSMMRHADFTYPNFDDLVDAPVQLGNFPVFKFDVNGIPHEVAMVGRNNADLEKLRDDMQLMCRTMAKVVNDHPCKRYTFIVQNVEAGGGGLEHKNSTVLMMSRWAYTDAARYKGFLGLVAHEYFHLWNVKRIRPAELGPFNYRQENYTDLLWLAEGITSYYDEIALMRAGIVTRKEFLSTMAGYVNAHENRMGARVATISEMSHDAWIKEYRPNENSKNSTYSYYSKGVIVGFLFDAWIAANTNGSKHLDDVMQYLWRTHYKNKALGEEGKGITEKEFIDAVKTVIITGNGNPETGIGTGKSFDQFAKQLLHSTEIPDYAALTKMAGIDTKITESQSKKFGLTCESSNGRTLVKGIHAHPTAAGFQLGVNVNDELIAVNGVRIENNIDDLYLKIGEPKEITLLVNRAGLLRECSGIFSTFPEVKYEFMLPATAKGDEFWEANGALQTLLK
ncbi:MAG: M61 family metallopeptidase [Bacteroidetes bacterium]|nr:M61 family metallopeptidase [Bacteroidota bacterium]